jgi:hypothetical protein
MKAGFVQELGLNFLPQTAYARRPRFAPSAVCLYHYFAISIEPYRLALPRFAHRATVARTLSDEYFRTVIFRFHRLHPSDRMSLSARQKWSVRAVTATYKRA